MNAESTQLAATSSGVLLRLGVMDDLDSLAEIDVDAGALFARAGIQPVSADAFSHDKLDRWRHCLSAGTAVVAVDSTGRNVGFAAVDGLDREPYLAQLSVRMSAMRQGIGTRLLNAASTLILESGGQEFWLITYNHLGWNRPFYERNGFVLVPPDACSSEMLQELSYERRWLPMPHERVVMCKYLTHEECPITAEAASA